jgi:iron complex outermembrane recepter protein
MEQRANVRRLAVRMPACMLISGALAAGYAGAEEAQMEIDPVVVTATRVEQRSFDVPASIDSIDQERIQEGQALINLSETLSSIPGVVANNRQNYAQDLQISIRGFGARSTFGVRGIRLYADGIPATMPDGQGQVSNFDLGSAKRIEVLRGPFSALYGNSSGGVIQIFTEDGPENLTASPSIEYGSFESSRVGLKIGGQSGPVNYIGDVSHFETEGFRDHSAARRDLANGKLRFDLGGDASLSLVLNYIDSPETQDPLGLTQAEVQQNREQASPVALQFNTRKSFRNSQGGLVYEKQVSEQDTVRLMGYVGDRQVQQFLAVPTGAQLAPTSAGGVIDLDRQFHGLDGRWTRKMDLLERPLTFSLGLNYDYMQERRQGYNNFIGPSGAPTALGVMGTLRRNEDNSVFNFDQYVQAQWDVLERWSVSAGVRHSRVSFKSVDYFIAGTNRDDGGSAEYSSTSPVVGVLFKALPALNLYANFGKGFETPAFNELSYQLPPVAGLNFGLRPARSKNYELGAKALLGNYTRVNAALFKTSTDDDIAVLQNTGGRSVFQNIDKTTRQGAELALDTRLPNGFTALLSYTYLEATFDTSFQTCGIAPPNCVFPATNVVTVPSGNQLPGVPQQFAYAEAGWESPERSFYTAFELRYMDKIYANDTNTQYAGAYAIANWRIGFRQEIAKLQLREFARVDNLFDRDYIGSVIVNEANGRYFEPSPGRTFLVGVSAAYAF